MGFKEALQRMKENQGSNVSSDGTLTTDKQLLSLRRQNRLLDEREEKVRLKQTLRRRAMENDRQSFTSSSMEEKKTILAKLPKDKAKKFMTAKNNLFS